MRLKILLFIAFLFCWSRLSQGYWGFNFTKECREATSFSPDGRFVLVGYSLPFTILPDGGCRCRSGYYRLKDFTGRYLGQISTEGFLTDLEPLWGSNKLILFKQGPTSSMDPHYYKNKVIHTFKLPDNVPVPKGFEVRAKSFQLIQAIKEGQEKRVIEILDGGHDPNLYLEISTRTASISQSDEILLPIFEAVKYGRVNILRKLLQYGADPRKKVYNTSALGVSSHPNTNVSDRIKCLEILLEAGLDVNTLNSSRENALLSGADRSYEEIKFLLDKGINPNVSTSSGSTPLEYLGRDIDRFRLLYNASGFNKSSWKGDPYRVLFVATNQGLPLIEFLLSSGVGINQVFTSFRGEKDTLLSYVMKRYAEENKLEVVTRLLEKGARMEVDIEGEKTTLVYLGSLSYEYIEKFLKFGADPNQLDENGCTPIARIKKKIRNNNENIEFTLPPEENLERFPELKLLMDAGGRDECLS